jgi:O-antigen/teichoic acid export membrane protein
MSLKSKAIRGFFWSFIEGFTKRTITFIIGLILARILSPREFGLLGMLTVFIGISTVFIYSGFNQALIRKKECTDADYSTIFYFNLGVSLLLYLILFLTAGLIADFYGEPILKDLIRVLGISLVINALTIVQRTKLDKRVDFKLLTRISVISSVTSGVIAIFLALNGIGVWSLIAQRVLKHLFDCILLWIWNKWKPKLEFNIESFKELWSFGGRLMILGVFNALSREIYQVVIGKFYPAAQLGQYNRAETFKRLPERNLRLIIERVTLPTMAPLQDDYTKLRNGYRKILNATFLTTSFIMVVLSAISIDLVEWLLGTKWHMAGEYLQILCFSAIFLPLSFLNQSILKTKNKAKLLLNLGIFIKLLISVLLVIVVIFDIKTMLYAMIVYEFTSFVIFSSYAGKFINYGPLKQLKDYLPIALIVGGIFLELYFLNQLLNIAIYQKLFILIITAIFTGLSLFELFSIESYIFLKNIAIERIKRNK